MLCHSVRGKCAGVDFGMVVYMSCRSSDCCGLGPDMAGVGHDILGCRWIAVDET